MSYKGYVESHPDLLRHYNENVKSKGTSMAAWGKAHWGKHGESEVSAGRRANKTPHNTTHQKSGGGGGGGGGTPQAGGNPNAVHPSYTPNKLHGANVLPSANPANPTPAQYAQYVDNALTGKFSTWALIEARLAGKDVSGMTGHANMTPEATADYWITRMGGGKDKSDFGKAHYTEAKGIHTGAYKSDFVPAGTGVRSFGGSAKTGGGAGGGAGGGQGGGGGGGGGQHSELNNIQTMDLASLTDEMMLSNAISGLLNTNSALFRAAETKALQMMAKRGIVNSSLARQSVMDAILAVAMPIAQSEVDTLQKNLYYNTDWSNKQKSDYNQYIYDRLKVKLQGAINYSLRRGDWVAAITSTPGMDTEAINFALGSLPNYPYITEGSEWEGS